MTDEESAREYLRRALKHAGVSMVIAAEIVGKNHAYIQQYVKHGKPRWLPEGVREALVKAYGLDAEKLKPPAVELRSPRPRYIRPSGSDVMDIEAPGDSEIAEDPSAQQLVATWIRVPRYMRQVLWRAIKASVRRTGTNRSSNVG